MERLLFGTGGVPHSAKGGTSMAGIERIFELGLGCMEMEFVQGVKMSETSAVEVGKSAKAKGVALSAHAPYYINLNAREPEKIAASKQRIVQTARVAGAAGAVSIVFHSGFYMGDPAEGVYPVIKENLASVVKQLKDSNVRVWIRPEVTGKSSQFGSLDELIRLSTELEGVLPCIDFAHLHARHGKLNSYFEFVGVLEQLRKGLGKEAVENIHIHVSGVEFGKQGERAHRNLRESDFNYLEFVRALADRKVRGLVIVESPNLEDDALLLQETYRKMAG